jgi:hypothetical protein
MKKTTLALAVAMLASVGTVSASWAQTNGTAPAGSKSGNAAKMDNNGTGSNGAMMAPNKGPNEVDPTGTGRATKTQH